MAHTSKYFFKTKNQTLQNLSDEQINSAITLYQDRFSTGHIEQNLGIMIGASNFYTLLPFERSETICSCGDMLYQKIPPNSDNSRQKILCLSCGHHERSYCTCEACKLKKIRWREEGMREFTILMMNRPSAKRNENYVDPFDE